MSTSPRSNEDFFILAVDDKLANLIAIERVLAGVPARIVRASSGEEALAASLRYHFALAILDVQMPGMDGYELAEILLADPSTSRIPIIFMTAAYSDENHVFKGYSAGAVDYIVKPYNPSILLAKVRIFLELERHRRNLEGIVVERTTALQASEARFEDLFNLAPQPLLMTDLYGKILQNNEAAERLFGYESKKLLNYSISTFIPDFDQYQLSIISTMAAHHRQGHRLMVEIHVVCLQDGNDKNLLISLNDVSDRIAALDAVQRSLHEKEVLLKEIHHRVKNNLQLVSSLLRLQSAQIPDNHIKGLFQDSITRVRSMSMVHEQLYSQESLAAIDFGKYAYTLVTSLRAAYAPSARILVKVQSVYLTIDIATPLGLILNEMISNAFKHGLSQLPSEQRRTGLDDVLIEVWSATERIYVAVSDSGPGLPASDTGTSIKLGMQLINSLNRQLRGNLKFDYDHGLRIVIDCALR